MATDEPAWPLVQRWIAEAKNSVEVLPPSADAPAELEAVQVTLRSHALVTLVGDDRLTYSCGMHAFGLPEVSCPGSLPIDQAGPLMNQFNLYQLCDSPILKDGETFALDSDPGTPRYRLRHRACDMYPPDDFFHNEAGVWHLEPIG